jgi:hypothetical protein
LHEDTGFDQANGIEDGERTTGLVFWSVLEERRVASGRPIWIRRVCRKLVEVPLFIEGAIPWQRRFDAEDVIEGGEPLSKCEQLIR